MALTQEKIKELVGTHGANQQDTGSPQVQIAMLTQRINDLTEHLKANKKDFACRRGLMVLVGQRRRMLNYYKNNNSPEAYKELITKLNIRK